MSKIILFACTLLVIQATYDAKAQTPFPAGTNVVLAKPGMNSAPKNYTLYTSTAASSSVFIPGVSFTPAYNINGIGINPLDNFIYGASFVGADNTVGNNVGVSLHRIGMDGTDIDLGLLPTSGQTAIEFPNFSAGTISATGSYYYISFGLKPSGVAKFLAAQPPVNAPLNLDAGDLRIFVCWKDDVAALTANAGNNISGGISGFFEVDFSNPDVTAAINAFLTDVNANYPNIYNADGGIQDFAINPVDLNIYGYISYPQGGSGGPTVGRPVVVTAPVSGMAAVTPVGTTINAVPGQEVAGVQFDPAGNFYGLFTTGDYAQIDLTTGQLTGLTPSNIAVSGGNLRGDIAPAVTNIPFPVQLVSFTGKNKTNGNELNWLTASEKNCLGFALERSADERNWSEIAFVSGKGAGNGQQYAYTDRLPLTGDNYYRLKIMDNDGKSTFSTTLLLKSGARSAFHTYPSPVKNKVSIEGAATGNQLSLLDMSGKVLIIQQVNAAVMQLSLEAYPTGYYFITETKEGKIISSAKLVRE